MKCIKQIAMATICGVLAASALYFDGLYELDNMAADRLYQESEALDGTIRVLGIDERSLEQLGPFQTWSRSDMADIINALNGNPQALPAVIGIDIMYFGETDAQSDDKLAAACETYGNVVVGSNIIFDSEIESMADGSFIVDDFHVSEFEEPFEALKVATRQGHVNTMPDLDGIMRSNIHTALLPDGRISNSFAYEIYQLYAEKNDLPAEATPPMNGRNQWYVPFSGMPGDYSDGYSVVDILNGEISPEIFEDCIVLIGPYATGMQDAYVSAIDHGIPMYGVEIHANIIQALLDGDYKTAVPNTAQAILAFFVIFGAYFAFRSLKPKFSTPAAIALIGGYLLIADYLGERGSLLKVIYLPIGIGLLYFGWLAANYVRENLEKKKVKDAFKKYVAPAVVDELFRNKDSLKLGGEKRDISCMFVDIRGFTPMSEVLAPEQVVEMLNQYLDLTSKAVFKHQGMLDKFIGDATMAVYNAPLDLEDYVYRSVLTAWDIVKGAEELNETLLNRYGKSVTFGIGLNCGPAVVGNIGTEMRMDYTAIGDTVNTAARLESQARPGQVLLSETVYQAVKNRIKAVPLGEISLKGKTAGVKVYGLMHINEFMDTQEALATAQLPPGKDRDSHQNENGVG